MPATNNPGRPLGIRRYRERVPLCVLIHTGQRTANTAAHATAIGKAPATTEFSIEDDVLAPLRAGETVFWKMAGTS